MSKAEAEQGWFALMDGESLFGWTTVGGGQWTIDRGALVPQGDVGHVRTNGIFADFTLRFEYQVDASGAPCAVSLRSSLDGDPLDTGYELRLSDGDEQWPAGSIVGHLRARGPSRRGGDWRAVEATLSAEQLIVRMNGNEVVNGRHARARAGHIAFLCGKGGRVRIRNIAARLAETKTLFNGTDLSGWKVLGPPPRPKAGLMKRIIGAGGATTEAVWSVVGGVVRGEKGVGQLETASVYDDFALQLTLRVRSSKRDDHGRSSVFLRGDPGQAATGYELTVHNSPRVRDGRPVEEVTGSLRDLQRARKVLARDNEFFTVTVVAHGRHVQVWVEGQPVTDFQDTRAEGAAPQRAARTAGGPVSLQLGEERSVVELRSARIASLPKTLGKAAAPPSPALAIPPPLAPPSMAAPAPGAPVVVPDPTRAQVQQLMAQVLATDDPSRQLELYTQILLVDPSNQVAFTGRQQAQERIDAASTQRALEQAKQEDAARTTASQEAQGLEAKQRAEDAFVSGDLAGVEAALAVAEKALPGDPRLAVLRARLAQTRRAETRMTAGLAVAGGVALVAAVGLLIRRGRGHRVPYLEVAEGLDKGKRFSIPQDVVRIGAVPQDGGQKNDVVVRDVGRLVSRFHCEIHKSDRGFLVVDLGSANGTSIDGAALEPNTPKRLKRGARLDLAGSVVLTFGLERQKKA